jgi:hypothetical protein
MIGLVALLVACEEPEPVDLRDPAPVLEVPPVDAAVVEVAASNAIQLALGVDHRIVWGGHVDALDARSAGCPDIFVGAPNLDVDVPDGGLSWNDLCSAPGDLRYAGHAWWENGLDADGDAATAEGRATEAYRRLQGDALVTVGDDVLFEIDGEAEDDLTRIDADGFSRWVYSSRVDGVVGGTLVDNLAPGGMRADVVLRATGGDTDQTELRANLYFYEHRLETVFDSVAADLEWPDPDTLGEDGCALEPTGWMGVRDTDGYWYDLVFQPRYDDPTDSPYPNEPHGPCDGCASLYVRGIEQDARICPDFSFVPGFVAPPEPAAFALNSRELLGGVE